MHVLRVFSVITDLPEKRLLLCDVLIVRIHKFRFRVRNYVGVGHFGEDLDDDEDFSENSAEGESILVTAFLVDWHSCRND